MYLVENSIGLSFALKVLHKDVELEKRGVESVMRIQSNRLIKIIDYGETVTGDACILMEYVKDNLADQVAGKKPVGEEKACHYFEEILKGLQVLEENGVVHRDIKPANLFTLEDIVKIGDFGLSRYTSGESSHMTSGLGTIEYAAPESFEKHYSYSADWWAAAVVFFRLITGRMVFQGNSQKEIFKKIMLDEPDLSVVPEKYQGFLEQCFRKKPKDRYTGIETMLLALKNCAGGPAGCDKEPENKNPGIPETKDSKAEPAKSQGGAINPGIGSSGNLDEMLKMVAQKEAALKKKKDLEAESRKEIAGSLKADVAKFNKIVSSSFGKDIAAAAWEQLVSQYPEARGLSAGNVEGLFKLYGLPPLNLRRKPLTVSEDELRKVFKLGDDKKPLKYVENDYSDNGDGTITDEATGLIWQQVGSDDRMKLAATEKYIDSLNREQFAGYTDWRLPMIDEMASLLEPEKQSNSKYINPVFSSKQEWCWSADKRSSGSAWGVGFDDGDVYWDFHDNLSYVRAVRSWQ